MSHGGGGQEGGGDVEGHLVVTGVDCLALNFLRACHVNHESSDWGAEEGRESSNTGQDTKCGGQWRQTEHVNLKNFNNEFLAAKYAALDVTMCGVCPYSSELKARCHIR